MPVERRLFVLAMAVPVIVAVYAAAFGSRLCRALRPAVAALLGATVIGTVYVEEAWRRTAAPRVSPARASAVLALALVVAATGLPGATASAHSPSEKVIEIAYSYIGTPYRWGAESKQAVDCSGFMYRIFSDAGELRRIGGQRMRAVGYYRWFRTRGMISTNVKGGERGDLVYYYSPSINMSHIGIYLGDGRVISATPPAVREHRLLARNREFVAFLKVNWSVGDPKPAPAPSDATDHDNDQQNAGQGGGGATEENPTDSDGSEPRTDDEANMPRAYAIGTMNLRETADPNAPVIGWVRRGSTFAVLGTGHSPSGAHWLKVKTRSGMIGWVWSRWSRLLDS